MAAAEALEENDLVEQVILRDNDIGGESFIIPH